MCMQHFNASFDSFIQCRVVQPIAMHNILNKLIIAFMSKIIICKVTCQYSCHTNVVQ